MESDPESAEHNFQAVKYRSETVHVIFYFLSLCVCVCVFVCQFVHLSVFTLCYLYSIFNNGCNKCDEYNGYARMYISTRTIFFGTYHLNLIHLYQKGYTWPPIPFFLSSILLFASLFSTLWWMRPNVLRVIQGLFPLPRPRLYFRLLLGWFGRHYRSSKSRQKRRRKDRQVGGK